MTLRTNGRRSCYCGCVCMRRAPGEGGKFTLLPAMYSAHQGLPQSDRKSEVVKRGDHVMGFSHEATTHHFRLFKDGGEIAVNANDAKHKSSIDQIRARLGHIAQMFADGNFNAPM